MFLDPIQPDRSDRGSALVAVVGVMVIGMILTALVAGSVVSGLGFTSTTRADVQSQAAADAGIAAARAGLNTVGNCAAQPTAGKYISTVEPVYTAILQFNAGAGWQNGCPTAATTQVRIVSTGKAAALGVAGRSTGDTSLVEAVVNWITPGVDPSGVGMYLYKGGVFEANSSLDLSESTGAGLMIKNGDLTCDKNNSVINGSIFVNGSLTFGGTCTVKGDAWVTGLATLGSGRIDGKLTAGSVNPSDPSSQVGGGYTTITSSTVLPIVPNWTDVGYTPSDWTDSTGAPYEIQTLSGTGCTLSGNLTLGGTITGKPLIINALGCSGGISAGNNVNVRLSSDVVIFSNSFTGGNAGSFTSTSTAVRRLWFITPDYVADGAPTCGPGQGDFEVNNKLTITAPVQAFLYTPCAFDAKNTFTWNGQLYAGQPSNVKNNSGFTFVPIGVAGVDFDTAGPTPIVTHPKPGTLVSNRDLAN
jgi:Tfp pilus assembly protein PilX